MKLLLYALMGLVFIIALSCGSESAEKDSVPVIGFVEYEADKRVDVMVDGELFTSYRWPEKVYKPILYPVLTAEGTEITRGFPLKPREGESKDHMHQVGIWLNYGNVNGYDFWGNGSEGKRNINGGEVKHYSVEQLSGGTGEGTMVTTAGWIDPAGKELLAERTEYHFIARGHIRIIDRITTLTATGGGVSMNDTKEGMFGIRVARQLEIPPKDEVSLSGPASGNYRSSDGVTGLAVWGKRAKWMNLYGSIGREKISLVISGHPENINHPTYWHARGYGLLAANPFGVKDFTRGKEELNHIIPAGDSITLRYRVVISSGTYLKDSEINAYSDDFAGRY